MSVILMDLVWKRGPENTTERFVLLAIADHAKDDGSGAYPSLGTIAKKCALSRRSAIRAVNALVEQGYINRTRKKRDGEFTSSDYQLNVSRLYQNESIQVTTRSDSVSLPSDSVSLRVVTMSPPSDTESLEWCQPVTTGSDSVSPKPSLLTINEPLGNHQVTNGANGAGNAPTSPNEIERQEKQEAWEAVVDLVEHWEGLTRRKHPPVNSEDFRDNWLKPFNEIWIMCGHSVDLAKGKVQAVRDAFLAEDRKIFDPAKLPAHVKAMVDTEMLPITRRMNGQVTAPVLSRSEQAATQYAAAKRAILGDVG